MQMRIDNGEEIGPELSPKELKIRDVEKKAMVIWPVFYDIDPSDVEEQKGSFEKAFAEHEKSFKDDMDKVEKWRDALKEVCLLEGSGSTKTSRLVGANNKFLDCIIFFETLDEKLFSKNLLMDPGERSRLWHKEAVIELLTDRTSSPLKAIPDDLTLEHLIVLDMPYSSLQQFSEEVKDFSVIFMFLNLQDCVSLKNLPGSICALSSLKKLTVSGCSKLEELPEGLGEFAIFGKCPPNKTGSSSIFTGTRSQTLASLSDDMFPSDLQGFALLQNFEIVQKQLYKLTS
ncbi:hypothetical protein NC651_005323 [Populus alba x Populus x berolinensis]|nr:hypothetical protein NC651_005323 [Populus alba x Populus x berolinensis]